MPGLSRHALIFAASSYIAVILALFIALRLDLQNPWWAMASVYFGQPTQQRLTGAVWAKAIYRIAGTAIGGIVCILIIPALASSAVLLLLVIGAWLGVCVFGALFDRSPRAYLFLLAGYTVVLVGLPAAFDPAAIFDTVLARVEEITIGVLSLAVVQSLLFPISVGDVALNRLDGVIAAARAWISDGLATLQPAKPQGTLVTDLAAISALATDWRFEGTFSSRRRRALWALEERLATLIPTITSVEDRIVAVQNAGAGGPELLALSSRVGVWIKTGQAADVDAIVEDIATLKAPLGPDSTWPALLRASLAVRLLELVTLWSECLQLVEVVRTPDRSRDSTLDRVLAASRPRALHVDPGVAALSSFAAVATVLVLGAFSIATRWEYGGYTMGVASVACVLFATFDDPTPMARDFSIGLVGILPVLLIYEFAVLPAIDGFPLLALSLAPVLIPLLLGFTVPKHMVKALGMMAGFTAGLALQPRFQADLPSLLNLYLAVAIGPFLAAVGMSLVRIIPTERAARRLVRAGWRELAGLARGRVDRGRAVWTSRMVDRVGLLIPRLLLLRQDQANEVSELLRETRFAQAIVEMRQVRDRADPAGQLQIDAALEALAAHFSRGEKDAAQAAPTSVLTHLDAGIGAALHLHRPGDRQAAVSAMLSLRRGLFPTATTYPWAGQGA